MLLNNFASIKLITPEGGNVRTYPVLKPPSGIPTEAFMSVAPVSFELTLTFSAQDGLMVFVGPGTSSLPVRFFGKEFLAWPAGIRIPRPLTVLIYEKDDLIAAFQYSLIRGD